MTDYKNLLQRYLQHTRRLNRGRDLLEDGCMAPFSPDEIGTLRRLSDARPVNPSALMPEKVGGATPGDRPAAGWFAESLKGL